MTIKFQRVAPGDLITATLMNDMMDALEALDAALGSTPAQGTKAVIDGFSPAGPVRPGDELRVIGRNFGSQPSLNVITLNGLRADAKAGSNQNLIIFDVPPISSIPAEGVLAQLLISTPNGYVMGNVQVLPNDTMPLGGDIAVSLSPSSTSAALVKGGTYNVVFKMVAQTTALASYLLQIGTDQGDWTAFAPDPANPGNKLSTVTIPKSPSPGTTIEVPVTLNIANTVTSGAQAKLHFGVVAVNKPDFNFGLTLSLTEGQPLNVQTKIVLSLHKIFPPGKNVGGTVEAEAAGDKVPVHFIVRTKDVGSYTVVQPFVVSDAKWGATLKLSSPDFTTITADQETTIITEISAQASAPDATLTIAVKNKNNSDIGSLDQPLHLK